MVSDLDLFQHITRVLCLPSTAHYSQYAGRKASNAAVTTTAESTCRIVRQTPLLPQYALSKLTALRSQCWTETVVPAWRLRQSDTR